MYRIVEAGLVAGVILAACAADNTGADPGESLVAIEISPSSAILQAGQQVQFTAMGRKRNGSDTSVTVTWSGTGGTITSDGLFTAGTAPGEYSVIAALVGASLEDRAGITVTPDPIVDVSRLPEATGQHPVAGTYGRTLAAGATYVDPNTNVTVLKLTSASVPMPNSGMYHGYSEGGPTISQPWRGTDGLVWYTAKVGAWLVDIRYSTMTTANWRRVEVGETMFAFSLNPATPRIAYVITSGRRVDRVNTASMSLENTGGWPWSVIAPGDNAAWLQTQVNDTWLTLMLNSNHTVVSFRPSDGFQRVVTQVDAGVSIDEPHMDRELGYVYLSTNSEPYNKIVNLASGSYTDPSDPSGINADDHAAPLRGRVVSMSWPANGVISVTPNGQVGIVATPVTDWGGDWHMAGQWVFNNPDQYFLVDQWKGTGAYPIYKGMIGLVSVGNDKRILAAHDAQGTGYDTGGQPHPTFAPDGKLVMWTSNMNNSGRFDTFVARVPVR